MRQIAPRLLLLTAFLPLAVACGSDDSAPEDGGEGGSASPPAPMCSARPFLASEAAGLTEADPKGGIKARIVEAEHIPPMFGYNDWTIALLDDNDAPLPNAKIAWACSWMLEHTHGANPTEINDLGEGRFAIKQQNLAMYGQWLVRFWVTTDPSKEAYLPQKSTDVLGGDVCAPRDATLGVANIEFTVCVLRD
jgi:hypothetical protein